MSVITEFTIPAEAFALRETFDTVPDVTFEIERVATHSREWIMPFLWVTTEDIEAVEDALRVDPAIVSLERIDHDEGIGQFRVEWAEDFQALVDEIVDQHGIVQEAEAANGRWYLKIKFVEPSAVSQFQSFFRERGVAFELQRLYDGTSPKEREYDLSSEQREVLVTALEKGYFSVPREAQIEDLADALGISASAVSQRLRRATSNLTKNTLTVFPPDDVVEED